MTVKDKTLQHREKKFSKCESLGKKIELINSTFMAEWKQGKNPGLSLILEMDHKYGIYRVLDTLFLEIFI